MEHEGVAFIFNSLGTWTNGAIRPYLNINEIPQLFVASGAEMFAEPEGFPWTMGWQPSYQTEAAIFGKHMLATKSDAKIGVLYQDDRFGKDYMVGLKEGLGAKHAQMIVETATYETGALTINSQVVAIRRAGADTFLIVAPQELAEQAINKAFDIGWTPIRYVTGVSQSISSTMTATGLEKLKGAITAVYDKDPSEHADGARAAFKYYYIPVPPNGIAGIVVEPTEELLRPGCAGPSTNSRPGMRDNRPTTLSLTGACVANPTCRCRRTRRFTETIRSGASRSALSAKNSLMWEMSKLVALPGAMMSDMCMWHDGHQVITTPRPSFCALSLKRATVRAAILLAARG